MSHVVSFFCLFPISPYAAGQTCNLFHKPNIIQQLAVVNIAHSQHPDNWKTSMFILFFSDHVLKDPVMNHVFSSCVCMFSFLVTLIMKPVKQSCLFP